MRILQWIFANFLYRKPHNWARVDDHNLYLMQILLRNVCSNWVKFILSRIEYSETSSHVPLLFSSFIQVILDLNGISSADEDLVKTPKPIDSNVISLMHYFKDENNVYYYLDNVGRYIYEDKIEVLEGLDIKHKKKNMMSIIVPGHIGSSSSTSPSSSDRLLSNDAKAYLDGLVSKIMVDSHIREKHFHVHIDLVAKEEKERDQKIQAKLYVVKGLLNHLKESTLVFNINDYDPSSDPLFANVTQLFHVSHYISSYASYFHHVYFYVFIFL